MLRDVFQKAFPSSLADSVGIAASVLLPSRYEPAESRGVNLAAEQLRIPYRIYNDTDPTKIVEDPEASVVLACMLTRHWDGRERQRNVAALYSKPYDWVAPFVLLLIGEYVIEILNDIENAIPHLYLPTYHKIISENPDLWTTTQRRVTSYWNVYYRSRFPKRSDYVGFRILSKFEQGTATS